jgi:hypothetical protein
LRKVAYHGHCGELNQVYGPQSNLVEQAIANNSPQKIGNYAAGQGHRKKITENQFTARTVHRKEFTTKIQKYFTFYVFIVNCLHQ